MYSCTHQDEETHAFIFSDCWLSSPNWVTVPILCATTAQLLGGTLKAHTRMKKVLQTIFIVDHRWAILGVITNFFGRISKKHPFCSFIHSVHVIKNFTSINHLWPLLPFCVSVNSSFFIVLSHYSLRWIHIWESFKWKTQWWKGKNFHTIDCRWSFVKLSHSLRSYSF